MSYRQSYTEYVPYSGTVHYSGSRSCSCGNSVSYSGSEGYSGSEPVTINIFVDTTPFDAGVNSCKNSVNLLTGSIVATQAAQIAEINKSAAKISQTMINGFFKTVGSEISQQIAALENEVNSTLLHLNEAMKKIVALKGQMEKDYGKITERYVKTFDDLNTELSNRVWQLDSKTFQFEETAANNANRFLGSDLSTTVSVFGKESASLSAKISAGSVKDKAFIAINKARAFLYIRKQMDRIIEEATIPAAKEKTFYVPGCFMETHDKSYNVLLAKENEALDNSETVRNVAGRFRDDDLNWQNISDKECEQISVHLNACVNEAFNSHDPRTKRIREMTQKLINLQGVQTCMV